MDTDREVEEALARAKAFGIDLTLVYEALKLTPTERLRRLDHASDMAEAFRRAGRKKYGPFPPPDQRSVPTER